MAVADPEVGPALARHGGVVPPCGYGGRVGPGRGDGAAGAYDGVAIPAVAGDGGLIGWGLRGGWRGGVWEGLEGIFLRGVGWRGRDAG